MTFTLKRKRGGLDNEALEQFTSLFKETDVKQFFWIVSNKLHLDTHVSIEQLLAEIDNTILAINDSKGFCAKYGSFLLLFFSKLIPRVSSNTKELIVRCMLKIYILGQSIFADI